ncbi:MAG: hypothetical protein EP330_08700 [Deltaproteobacteria bacterium]|nr:MAG: hypothetical protein EP330_08700 [Deltaproteobacteria bacterium]
MRELQRYWPERVQGTSIINADADVIQEPSVVLATHQEVTLLKQSVDLVAGDGAQGVEVSEEEFLDYFLQDCDNANMLAPITGRSGCGKSHFIVWLEARLLRRDDADRRHIIRIPKGASFRSVIRRILADLRGDAYTELHERVKRAGNSLTTKAAREWVVAGVNIALDNIHADLTGALERYAEVQRTDEVKARIRDLQQRLRHATGLQALLSDNLFKRDHFFAEGQAIDRIAVRIVHGKKRSADPIEFQVAAEDFVLPEELERLVSTSAGAPAQAYYQWLMGETQRNRDKRALAAQVMNQALDLAIPRVLQLGDNELNEVLRAIREQLEEEGRELVFLAEDFSVLAGIQGALLDAMTVPRGGAGRPLCVMRTALAVTDGYISERDTIATRARFQFRMPERVVDQETIVDFVAEYLNAERHGTVDLNAWYREQADGPSSPLLPPLEIVDLDREYLDAFGYSTRGIPLFPLSRTAIREILRVKLRTEGGGLVFHPRTIVNHVLIEVFKNHARSFAHGQFPPAAFELYKERPLDSMAPLLTSQVMRLAPTHSDGQRWLVLLRFWGGAPIDMTEARSLNARVYEAFGLPVLPGTAVNQVGPGTSAAEGSGRRSAEVLMPISGPSVDAPTPGTGSSPGAGLSPGPSPSPSPGAGHSPGPSPSPGAGQSPRPSPGAAPRPGAGSTPTPGAGPGQGGTPAEPIQQWDRVLTEWRNGAMLPTEQANLLRTWVLGLVLRHVDWEAEGLRQPVASLGAQKKVWLGEAAAGGIAEGACHIRVGGLEVDTDADRHGLHLALQGLVRFELGGWRFDFENADVLYEHLMARLATWHAQFVEWYRASCPDLVVAEVKLLSALAVIERGSMMTLEDVGDLFERHRSNAGGPVAWRDLHHALDFERASRIDLLLGLVGIFQGGHVDARQNQQLLALDGWRILCAMEGLEPSVCPEISGLSKNKTYQRNTEEAAREVAKRWTHALAAQRSWLRMQSERVLTSIPADAGSLHVKLQNVLEIARERGLGLEPQRQLKRALEAVEGDDLAEARGRLAAVSGRPAEIPPYELARASTPAVVKLVALLDAASSLMDAVEPLLDVASHVGGSAAEAYRREVDGLLGAFVEWTAPELGAR